MRIYILIYGFFGSLFCAGIWMLFFQDQLILKKYRIQKDAKQIWDDWSETVLNSYRKKRDLKGMEKELYQGVIFLQNYAILQQNAPKGAIYTTEQLMNYMDKLKAPLELLVHYMRMNRGREGIQIFVSRVNSKYAEGFAKILVSLDEMKLDDVRETLEMFRQNIREENITMEKRRIESLSDLVYIPVICNVMLVFINFIYIAYYAQQKELFQQLLF